MSVEDAARWFFLAKAGRNQERTKDGLNDLPVGAWFAFVIGLCVPSLPGFCNKGGNAKKIRSRAGCSFSKATCCFTSKER